MLLGLETATNICSVAFQNEEREIFEKRSETHNSHSENLFLFIEGFLKEHDFNVSDLEAVLVSEGPGSYTGLRIAASGVKGLLFGGNVPLFGVNTLASFAMAAARAVSNVSLETSEAPKIHSIIDARRKHLYHQSFRIKTGQLSAVEPIKVREIDEFEKMVQPHEVIIGTGLERIDESISQKVQLLDETTISAQSLIQLFEEDHTDSFYQKADPAAFSPEYYSTRKPQINKD